MKKDDLLGIFRTCHNNCKIVYASMILLGYYDTPDFFLELYKKVDIPKPYKSEDLLPLLYDKNVLKIAMAQLYDNVHIAALKDLFEQTKMYCSETSQLAKFEQQHWYEFWRILRNCFSHDFTFHFNKSDKKKLPVTWNCFTIDASLEGTKLTHGQLSREKFWVFLLEVRSFIENDLA